MRTRLRIEITFTDGNFEGDPQHIREAVESTLMDKNFAKEPFAVHLDPPYDEIYAAQDEPIKVEVIE